MYFLILNEALAICVVVIIQLIIIIKMNMIQRVNTTTKNEIQTEITNCLKEIDPKYFNPNLNLMKEIVNMFGDIDFEKVKIDIERLNQISEKLDMVIKLIVDKHSDEFFKILGFVREMKKMLEASKQKYTYAKVSIGSLIDTISNLITGENSEWKLRSIFCAEIVSKLTKTKEIFELLQDCDVYIKHNKLYEAIILLKNNTENHYNYDKEFRNFNLLVNVNLRFIKIEEEISERLLMNMLKILFFNDEAILYAKTASLVEYFINYYSKISIDSEVTKPMHKISNIISHTVQYHLEEELGLKFVNSSNNSTTLGGANGGGGNSVDILEVDSDKKISSLVYLIKCLGEYSKSKAILIKFQTRLNENLTLLLSNSIKVIHDQLKGIEHTLTKYFLETKSEKIKFLLFIQVPMIILYHSLSKTQVLLSHLNITGFDINKVYFAYECALCLPLMIFNRTVCILKQEEDITLFDLIKNDFFNSEAVYKHKINDQPFVNIEYLPIAYKLYYQFGLLAKDSYQISFQNLNAILKKYTTQLYSYYSNRISIKKYFDIGSFIFEYDSEINNFKFINDLIEKVDELKRLLVFAFDNSYTEIMKIIKGLFLRYYDDMKMFIDKIKKDCVHHNLFTSLYEIYLKQHPNLIKRVLLNLQFRQYQKQSILTKEMQKDSNEDMSDIHTALVKFVVDVVRTTKPNDNIYLITRNYKLMELITKFIANTEALVLSSENFIIDLMKQEFTQGKLKALLEQVGQIVFDNVGSEANNDISTLILVSLANYDKISYELLRLVLLCKIEFVSLLITLARNMSKTSYWLNEPQMTPEYFVTSFVNDFLMYNNLFQYNLSQVEYDFIKEDYLMIINNIFIALISNLNTNAINSFGVNLLVRNFEYIKDKLGSGYSFKSSKFTETIFYFVNYIKILTLNEERLEEEIKKYYDKEMFNKDFIAPLLKIRTHTRHTLNETDRNKIVTNIFK